MVVGGARHGVRLEYITVKCGGTGQDVECGGTGQNVECGGSGEDMECGLIIILLLLFRDQFFDRGEPGEEGCAVG